MNTVSMGQGSQEERKCVVSKGRQYLTKKKIDPTTNRCRTVTIFHQSQPDVLLDDFL
jgi:hypothetical protein